MNFKINSPIMDFLNTTVHFIALNLVFILCCLPIITIGPAITALYQVVLKEVRGEHSYLIRNFFQYFKEIFLQAFLTSLFFALLMFVSAFSIVFWGSLTGSLAVIMKTIIVIFTIIIVSALLYVFPLMARFKNTLMQTIKNAFLIAITNIKSTLILLLIQVFVISIIYIFPASKILMLFIGFSFIAFCNSYVLSKVFKLYEPVTNESDTY